MNSWMSSLWSQLSPATEFSPSLTGLGLLGLAILALLMVPTAWRLSRVVITLVHELGHALMGIAVGRKFSGFVLRGDMSGHAVTVGPATGAGRVATTWAGYPAPALVGAGLVWLAAIGWSQPALALIGFILLATLIRVRSAYTLTVLVVVLVGIGALWWWGSDAIQALTLTGVGTFLILGAWRHLAVVFSDHNQGSDPHVLARLTRVPRILWLGSYVVTLTGATWVGALALR